MSGPGPAIFPTEPTAANPTRPMPFKSQDQSKSARLVWKSADRTLLTLTPCASPQLWHHNHPNKRPSSPALNRSADRAKRPETRPPRPNPIEYLPWPPGSSWDWIFPLSLDPQGVKKHGRNGQP